MVYPFSSALKIDFSQISPIYFILYNKIINISTCFVNIEHNIIDGGENFTHHTKENGTNSILDWYRYAFLSYTNTVFQNTSNSLTQ